MLKRISYLFSVLLFFAYSADAEPVIVELYTSQGCSSCPPADNFLSELSSDNSVIPLAFHVPYWDYIGWKDEFARQEHTARQKGYARRHNTRTIATPQFIIHGSAIISGARPMKIMRTLERYKHAPTPISLEILAKDGKITIEAVAKAPFARPVDVSLYKIINSQTVNIKRGENRGRKLIYTNIVTSADMLGQWSGKTRFFKEVNMPGQGEGVVVIIQDPHFGAIRAAKRFASR